MNYQTQIIENRRPKKTSRKKNLRKNNVSAYKIEIQYDNKNNNNNSTSLELKSNYNSYYNNNNNNNNSNINNSNNYNSNNYNSKNNNMIGQINLYNPKKASDKIGYNAETLKVNNVINYSFKDEFKSERKILNKNNVEIEIKSQYNYKKGKHFTCCLAYLILFINFILPGIGTMIATSYITDSKLKADYCCSGFFQLIMSIILIGWFLALCHSCFFIGASQSNLSFEAYYDKMKN